MTIKTTIITNFISKHSFVCICITIFFCFFVLAYPNLIYTTSKDIRMVNMSKMSRINIIVKVSYLYCII